tara:strand:+ start:958 stop:1218 length:261 start_codon:yes stop_codon:yes gene_type:complete
MKYGDVFLKNNDLLNGIEVSIIIQGLALLNQTHKENVKDLKNKGKIPFMEENYFDTIINHGLLWKLKKLTDKESVENCVELKKGKL